MGSAEEKWVQGGGRVTVVGAENTERRNGVQC